MKKIAMIFSVAALIFAYSTVTVSAQKAPEKAKTEKVSDSKTPKADVKATACPSAKAGCTGDKAKAGCDKASAGCDKAKAGCTGDKAKAGCCGAKAAATPVPAPTEKK